MKHHAKLKFYTFFFCCCCCGVVSVCVWCDICKYIQAEGCDKFDEMLACLGTPPLATTARYNPQHLKAREAEEMLQAALPAHPSSSAGGELPAPAPAPAAPQAYQHPTLPDVVVLQGSGPFEIVPHAQEVTVGLLCGMAVLRGAQVFAPGVLGVEAGVQVGGLVSVWADLEGSCLRGCSTKFPGRKCFVGNGRVTLSRLGLFQQEKPKGIYVEMTGQLYRSCSLDKMSFKLVPQNIPSCVAVHELDPQPGEAVLGKRTHTSAFLHANRSCLDSFMSCPTPVAASHISLPHPFLLLPSSPTPLPSSPLHKTCVPPPGAKRGT